MRVVGGWMPDVVPSEVSTVYALRLSTCRESMYWAPMVSSSIRRMRELSIRSPVLTGLRDPQIVLLL